MHEELQRKKIYILQSDFKGSSGLFRIFRVKVFVTNNCHKTFSFVSYTPGKSALQSLLLLGKVLLSRVGSR